jgi:hypothetical protein
VKQGHLTGGSANSVIGTVNVIGTKKTVKNIVSDCLHIKTGNPNFLDLIYGSGNGVTTKGTLISPACPDVIV